QLDRTGLPDAKLANDHMRNYQNDLGKLIGVHETGLLRYWPLFLLAFLLLTIAAILGEAAIKNGNNADAILVVLIFAALAIIPAFIGWYYSINKAELYEAGFVYTTRRSIKTVLWNEIKYVYKFNVQVNVNGISTAPQYRFAIRTEDDMIIRFSPRLADIRELGAILLNVAQQRNLPVIEGVPYRFGSPEPERTKMLDI
ncbi:MAG: DUF6585 family protein, partial [Pyrinomonadaceae bacterium]